MKIRELIKKFIYPILHYSNRKKLNTNKFTIVSDNCWAGKVYQELGLPYSSPFIGCFIFSPDYVKLVKDFKKYIYLELSFKNSSRYITNFNNEYPIANLGDIEIHFLHYHSVSEVKDKWYKRRDRIVWDNILFKMNDNDECSYRLLKEFNSLSLKGKVIFSATNYPNLDNLIFFKNRQKYGNVGIDLKYYHKYFNAVDWINKGGENLAYD